MKITEMNTRQLLVALCELSAPMRRIATDAALNDVFRVLAKKMQNGDRMTDFEKIGELLNVVPVLLESHYADMIRIIAIMTDNNDADVETMNGFAMIEELRNSIDKQFLDFFRSSAVTEQTPKVKHE